MLGLQTPSCNSLLVTSVGTPRRLVRIDPAPDFYGRRATDSLRAQICNDACFSFRYPFDSPVARTRSGQAKGPSATRRDASYTAGGIFPDVSLGMTGLWLSPRDSLQDQAGEVDAVGDGTKEAGRG